MKPTSTTTTPASARLRLTAAIALLVAGWGVAACSGTSIGTGTTASSAMPAATAADRPLTLASKVDLARYAGDWYVIGAIPTSFEDEAYNSKESYVLDAEGRMVTTFSFNKGSFTGPLKTYTSTGYILDKTNNAVWGQQYIWPIKADYRISYVAPDYSQVIVTREKRDYVWIMSRTPTLSDAEYQRLSARVASEGYDVTKLRKMPQATGR